MSSINIKQKLTELPASIRKLKVDILTFQNEAESIRKNIKDWELKQMSDIASEVDKAGKPVYSNDAKRQGRLLELKEKDEEYLTWDAEVKQLEKAVKQMEIELDYLTNLQKNLRAICRLGSDED